MKQIFYDANRNKIIYNLPSTQFNAGSNGTIYKLKDETCLKLFYPYRGTYPNRIFKFIIDLKLPNFYEVYQLLYNYNHEFIGYTMKYYQKEDIDILTMPTKYSLDNYQKIYKSATILNHYNISIQELIPINVILTEKDIIVIDIDEYKKDNITLNYRSVNGLFEKLYLYASFKHNISNAVDIMDNLFDEKDNFQTLSKKLSKYKYPIDYINNQRRFK